VLGIGGHGLKITGGEYAGEVMRLAANGKNADEANLADTQPRPPRNRHTGAELMRGAPERCDLVTRLR
jgi:hypothetical protein